MNGLNRKLDDIRINAHEDRWLGIIQFKEQGEKIGESKIFEQGLRDVWDNIKKI